MIWVRNVFSQFVIYLLTLLIMFLPHRSLQFLKDFIYLLLERGREKERKERNISVWLRLIHPPTKDLAHNSGMCPDWEQKR